MTGLLPPIRREIVVAAEPALAFRVFTEQLGSWWPLAENSVHGANATVAFVDGAIVETAPGQPDALWGRVTHWQPPDSLAFSWHPGRGADRASQVTVTFTSAGAQTLVRLEHAGWDVFADPQQARDEYGHGWPAVLTRYRDAVEQAGDAGAPDGDATWVALLHRPGPAAADVATVYDDPHFAEHVSFLERMRAAGYLVAAGPLPDEAGSGMTVLRLPGAGRLAEATHLAQIDDASVTAGFFTVTVRPWHVVLHA